MTNKTSQAFKFATIIVALYTLANMLCVLYIAWRMNISEKHIPEWFAQQHVDYYKQKVSKETAELGFTTLAIVCGYVGYALYSRKSLFVYSDWDVIERACDSCQITGNYDVVMGIKSGGGFVAPYLGQIHEIPWGTLRVKRNIGGKTMLSRSLKDDYKLNKGDYVVTEFDPPHSLKDKHVLLVDDGILSGGTVKTAKKYILEQGAKHIDTFVLHGKTSKGNARCFRDVLMCYGPWGLI